MMTCTEPIIFFQKEDPTHGTLIIIMCTRCEETLDSSSLEKIRIHEATCTMKPPRCIKVCHLCGLVSIFFSPLTKFNISLFVFFEKKHH